MDWIAKITSRKTLNPWKNKTIKINLRTRKDQKRIGRKIRVPENGKEKNNLEKTQINLIK